MITVQELIDRLQKIQYKSLPVYIYTENDDRLSILNVDELDDCVDININIDDTFICKQCKVEKHVSHFCDVVNEGICYECRSKI